MQVRPSRHIRPKPDDPINKNHMTNYKAPEDLKNRKTDDLLVIFSITLIRTL